MVTAQSATGTCQGPTIWSRATMPVTVRSPMVIRKFLLATAGTCSTCSSACTTDACQPQRRVPHLLPADIALHARRLAEQYRHGQVHRRIAELLSVSCRCNSSVASPTTAKGQRSRSQIASNRARFSGSTAST